VAGAERHNTGHGVGRPYVAAAATAVIGALLTSFRRDGGSLARASRSTGFKSAEQKDFVCCVCV